jgi:hypothetical protein
LLPNFVVVQPERQLRQPGLLRLQFEDRRSSERGELADALASVDEAAARRALAAALLSTVTTDDEIRVSSLGVAHANTVVNDEDLAVPPVVKRHLNPNAACIGIPRVRDQLGNGRSRARVHLSAKLLYEAASKTKVKARQVSCDRVRGRHLHAKVVPAPVADRQDGA